MDSVEEFRGSKSPPPPLSRRCSGRYLHPRIQGRPAGAREQVEAGKGSVKAVYHLSLIIRESPVLSVMHFGLCVIYHFRKRIPLIGGKEEGDKA